MTYLKKLDENWDKRYFNLIDSSNNKIIIVILTYSINVSSCKLQTIMYKLILVHETLFICFFFLVFVLRSLYE